MTDYDDHNRGTGRTTHSMRNAPVGSVYVWVNGILDYPRELAKKIHRDDLLIVSPDWLSDQRWVGLRLSGITVDHAATLTDRQWHGWEGAITRVGR